MHRIFTRVRMFLSLIFTGGPRTCIETAVGETDELRHMAIRLLHVRSFPTIPGSKESAHNWARTTLLCCKIVQMPCSVENEFERTRGQKRSPAISSQSREPQITVIRYLSEPRIRGVHRDRLFTVLGCERENQTRGVMVRVEPKVTPHGNMSYETKWTSQQTGSPVARF